MKIIFKYAIGLLTIYIMSCNSDLSYLDKIAFKDSTLNIQDSMKVMNRLLKKMSTEFFHPEYFIQGEIVLITVSDSTNIIVSLNDSVHNSNSIFNNLAKFEKNQFLRIATYLNNNYLSGARYDKMNSEVYFYLYHDLRSGANIDARYIVLLSDIKLTALQIEEKSFYSLIQIKQSLALFGVQDLRDLKNFKPNENRRK